MQVKYCGTEIFSKIKGDGQIDYDFDIDSHILVHFRNYIYSILT